MIVTPLQKLPNNVGNLGKKLLPQALNGCPKCKKSPNLVTLLGTNTAKLSFNASFKVKMSYHCKFASSS